MSLKKRIDALLDKVESNPKRIAWERKWSSLDELKEDIRIGEGYLECTTDVENKEGRELTQKFITLFKGRLCELTQKNRRVA